MACSGWQYVKAIQSGESFTALAEGLQEALWQLGTDCDALAQLSARAGGQKCINRSRE
jgi:hypothetical protein